MSWLFEETTYGDFHAEKSENFDVISFSAHLLWLSVKQKIWSTQKNLLLDHRNTWELLQQLVENPGILKKTVFICEVIACANDIF